MSDENKITDEVKQIAIEIAGPNSVDVDINSRFPVESLTDLKAAKIISAKK